MGNSFTNATYWYPSGNTWTSNTTNTIQVLRTWPTPEAVPAAKKGDPDPLDWLRERVEEICELSGIAA